MATNFEFLSNYDFEIRSPKGALLGVKNYRAGTKALIPEDHAKAAEEAKAGRRVEEAKAEGEAKPAKGK